MALVYIILFEADNVGIPNPALIVTEIELIEFDLEGVVAESVTITLALKVFPPPVATQTNVELEPN